MSIYRCMGAYLTAAPTYTYENILHYNMYFVCFIEFFFYYHNSQNGRYILYYHYKKIIININKKMNMLYMYIYVILGYNNNISFDK